LTANGYNPVKKSLWDRPGSPEWYHTKSRQYFAVSASIFDTSGNLRAETATNWDKDWIQLKTVPVEIDEDDEDEDEDDDDDEEE
jgi:hypothetical protein